MDGDLPKAAPPAPDPAQIMISVGEAAYEWQLDTDALTWTGNAATVLGLRDTGGIASGRAFANLLDPGSPQTPFDVIARSQRRDDGAGVFYQAQYCISSGPRSAKTWIEDSGRWFAGPDGRPLRAHGVVRAINDRHEREQQLAYLSRFDALTGEFNRWYLTEQLDVTLQESIRAQNACAFLLVAVDNLARVNEAYGYQVADEVIAAIAKRMRTHMRAHDMLGRFSGNKFGIILKDCTPDDLTIAATRLLAAIRDDVVKTAAGPVAVTITIGGVVAPRHAQNVREILARVQESLDGAKAKRRGSFLAYRPNIERETRRLENVRATDAIIAALKEQRITLAFEPVAGAATRAPVFYECLMRMQRADGTLAHAHEIIPVAERLGLVRKLDHRVLALAVGELEACPDLRLSVNVSPGSTTDPDWWLRLTELLNAHRGVAERLMLEITEMEAIQDIDDARGFVARVKDLGCRIAIDDFGAGYTSFRNLRKLGVDLLKIDGAFVQNLMRSEDDRAFVQTLIDLGKRLRLETVAEWVQDEKAAALLAQWGCDYLQGSLVGLASVDRPWLASGPKTGRSAAGG